ncbi:MAG: exopolysaccharide production protein ExoQ [Gammaproteobacteria bacterium]|jgi:exopolysaccharide production protein ExoQ
MAYRYPTAAVTVQHLCRRILTFIFILYLCLIFIGLQPFDDRGNVLDIADTGGGSLQRQIAFLSLAFCILVANSFISKRPVYIFRLLLPKPVILLFAWCLITLYWSPVASIGFRRLGLTFIVVVTVFAAAEGLGHKRILYLLAYSLVVFIFASLVSGLFVGNAIHQSNELSESLIGAWRGIFGHKNHAGYAASITIIMAFFLWHLDRRRLWLVALAAGVLLLFLAKSKTSMILLIPSIVIGLTIAKFHTSELDRPVLKIILGFLLLSLAVLVNIFIDSFGESFSNPESFTGRMAIWDLLWDIIRDNFIGGVGFGSMYHVGLDSPLTDYVNGWLIYVAHGHNGYLDLWVSIGVIGLVLTVYGFVFRPSFQLLGNPNIHPRIVGLLMSVIVFMAAHNLFESTLLNGDSAAWVVLIIVCAIADNLAGNSRQQS